MRSSIAAVFVPIILASSSALAGPSGGGDRGSGGRLGRVSDGIGRSVGSDHDKSAATTGKTTYDRDDHGGDPMYRRIIDNGDVVYVDVDGRLVRRIPKEDVTKREVNRLPARVDFFLGVQKVVESETAASASLAISDDWFRLAGTLTRYWEDRMDGAGKLTMTMPTLVLGVPLQQGGGSRAYLEGGVAHVSTANDPTADSSITGGKLGLHLEQPVRSLTFVGDAHALLFESDVRAFEARLGVRYKNFEGAIRVLDFNVGPPLYGPEIGVAF